ncbi:DUF982 domain-containing protein [Rhizobium ruizarguesonis]|uniref:DUF982 domain-containing protein n=1 Tax=Rhizobium ruizarguesonis TaxID=2081791 RepID=UPI00102F5035|nr:DUF982 domain-containing protein [Rhizobium ruizarguesonis]MBX4860148.1 DUF982 domain-containing protein [Rhizobium bangladeshense]NKL34973.1 DUF982 domain-containing protein [Rhizobium leguminosarum bv. viciae]TBD47100.1 DUF982 domain-containing protein [Rhizobium ruizarguesonis]
MGSSHIPVPVRPLHVEIDGMGRYRQAYSVEDLAALLLGDGWPRADKTSHFHRAVATSLDAMELYLDPEIARAAFVNAAHAAGMHVLPDDMAEMKKAG